MVEANVGRGCTGREKGPGAAGGGVVAGEQPGPGEPVPFPEVRAASVVHGKTISVSVRTQKFNATQAGSGRAATGGLIRGAGSGTSDSIPMLLSNREYVVNAKAAAANLALLEYLNRGGRLAGYARGGVVNQPIMSRPAAQQVVAAAAPVVYVENPWTGEYLLARTTTAATAAVGRSVVRAGRNR